MSSALDALRLRPMAGSDVACGCPPTIQNPRVIIGEGSYVLLAVDREGGVMVPDGRRAAYSLVQALEGLRSDQVRLFKEALMEFMLDDLERLVLGHEVPEIERIEP